MHIIFSGMCEVAQTSPRFGINNVCTITIFITFATIRQQCPKCKLYLKNQIDYYHNFISQVSVLTVEHTHTSKFKNKIRNPKKIIPIHKT